MRAQWVRVRILEHRTLSENGTEVAGVLEDRPVRVFKSNNVWGGGRGGQSRDISSTGSRRGGGGARGIEYSFERGVL